jgi:hypothetical protein
LLAASAWVEWQDAAYWRKDAGMMNRTNRPALRSVRCGLAIIGATILALGLGACRQSEQGRPLTYQKGVYQGPVDKPLSDAQLQELRHRGSAQKY